MKKKNKNNVRWTEHTYIHSVRGKYGRQTSVSDLMDCEAAELQSDSFVYSSDLRVAPPGAKLHPQAFRLAVFDAAPHKSQIINLRKMSCVWQQRPESVKTSEPRRSSSEKKDSEKKSENN